MLTLFRLFFACLTAIGYKPMIYQDFTISSKQSDDLIVNTDFKSKRNITTGNSTTEVLLPFTIFYDANYFSSLMHVIYNSNSDYYNPLDIGLPYSVNPNPYTFNFDYRSNDDLTYDWSYFNYNYFDGLYVRGNEYSFNKFRIQKGWDSSYQSDFAIYLFNNNTQFVRFDFFGQFSNDESFNGFTYNSYAGNSSNWTYRYFRIWTDNQFDYLNLAYQYYKDNYGTDTTSYTNGYQQGYDDGKNAGYQEGYSDGIVYSGEQSSTALTIFTGIIEVGLLPVNVFLKFFEYEVFGINIAGLISGVVTVSLIMILIRFIFGGKENGQ